MCSRPSVIFRTVAEPVSLLVLVGKWFLPPIPFSKLNSPAWHPPCHNPHAICIDSLSQLPTHLRPATSPTSSAVSLFLPVASPQAEPAPASGQLLRPMPGLNILPSLVAPYCPTLGTKAKVFNSGRHLVTPILPHSAPATAAPLLFLHAAQELPPLVFFFSEAPSNILHTLHIYDVACLLSPLKCKPLEGRDLSVLSTILPSTWDGIWHRRGKCL